MRGFPVEFLALGALVYFVLGFPHQWWEEMFDGMFFNRLNGHITVRAAGEEGLREVKREARADSAQLFPEISGVEKERLTVGVSQEVMVTGEDDAAAVTGYPDELVVLNLAEVNYVVAEQLHPASKLAYHHVSDEFRYHSAQILWM